MLIYYIVCELMLNSIASEHLHLLDTHFHGYDIFSYVMVIYNMHGLINIWYQLLFSNANIFVDFFIVF